MDWHIIILLTCIGLITIIITTIIVIITIINHIIIFVYHTLCILYTKESSNIIVYMGYTTVNRDGILLV